MTGCIPTSVPRDAFSDMENCVQQKLTVQWKCHFVRDMDPIILYHFNNLVSPYIKGRQDVIIFNRSIINIHKNIIHNLLKSRVYFFFSPA